MTNSKVRNIAKQQLEDMIFRSTSFDEKHADSFYRFYSSNTDFTNKELSEFIHESDWEEFLQLFREARAEVDQEIEYWEER